MTIALIGPDGRRYVLGDASELAAAKAQGYREESAAAPQTLGEQVTGAGSNAAESLGQGALGLLKGYTAGAGALLEGGHAHPDQDLNALPAAAPGITGDPLSGSPLQNEIDAREAARKAAAHPLARGAGEFAGMVLSPVNKVVAPIEGAIGATSLLGRLGAKGVANAAAGTLFGAGNALDDSVLGDHDLTAEKLIAGGGLGAVLGGAGGLFGGALEEGIAALPKLGAAVKGATGSLEDFATDRWLKAGGGIQSDIKKIPLDEHGAVADVFRTHVPASGNIADTFEAVGKEREAVAGQVLKQAGVGDAGGLSPAMDNDQATAALRKGFEAHGERVGNILKAADAGGAKFDHAALSKRISDFAVQLERDNPAATDLIEKDVAKTQDLLKRAAGYEKANDGVWYKTKKPTGFETANRIKSTLQGDINYVADSGAKNALRKQLVGLVRDEIDTQIAPQLGPALSKEFLDSKAAYGALKQASKAVKAKSTTGADAIQALVKGAGLATPETARLSALNHAHRLVTNGMARKLGNNWLGPMASLTGATTAVLHGGPVGVASGLAAAVAHKFMSERGPSVVARLADAIHGSPALSPIAASFAQKLGAVAPALGRYAEPLMQAAAQSPAHALATHMTLARVDPDYQHAATLAGFTPEAPEQNGHALKKAHVLASMAAQLDAHGTELDRSIQQVLKGTRAAAGSSALKSQDFGSKRMRRDSLEGHLQRVKEVRALAADPNQVLERVSANLGSTAELAPGVAGALHRTAANAALYLAKAGEDPPKAGPLAADWTPTNAQRHDFAQKLEVVQEPMSILAHAAAGTLTGLHVAALKAVYPRLAQTIADKTLEQLAANPKGVPYRARFMLSMLLGADVDGTLNPQAIARNQTAIHATDSKAPGAPQPPGERKSEQTLASRTALPNQQAEMTDGGEA